MNEQEKPSTLNDAIDWLEKAQQLGLYTASTARLLKVATSAVDALLATGEPRTLGYIQENQEQIYVRLLNRSPSINKESGKAYISRTIRLLRDHQSWKNNPTNFRPQPSRSRATESMGRKHQLRNRRAHDPRTSYERIADDEHSSLHSRPEDSETGYREHSLSLANGKAYIRLPEEISLPDFKLLMLTIGAHCPQASSLWTLTNKEGEAPSAL